MSTVKTVNAKSDEVAEAAIHGARPSPSQNSAKHTEQPQQPSSSTADVQDAEQVGDGTANDGAPEQQRSALVATRGPYQIMMLQAKQHTRYRLLSYLFFGVAGRIGWFDGL